MNWNYGLTDENVNLLIKDIAKELVSIEDLEYLDSDQMEANIKSVLYDEDWHYGLYNEIGNPFIIELAEELMNTENIGGLSDKDLENIIRGITKINWA